MSNEYKSFFLKKTAGDLRFILIERSELQKLKRAKELYKGQAQRYNNYSRHRRCRQPAKVLEAASSNTSRAAASGERRKSLKMRAFRSRQIAQITSRANDLAVLAGTPTKAEIDASQDGSDDKGRLQASGRSVATPYLSATLNHKDLDQGHSTSRCSAVSKLRIHSGQK